MLLTRLIGNGLLFTFMSKANKQKNLNFKKKQDNNQTDNNNLLAVVQVCFGLKPLNSKQNTCKCIVLSRDSLKTQKGN